MIPLSNLNNTLGSAQPSVDVEDSSLVVAGIWAKFCCLFSISYIPLNHLVLVLKNLFIVCLAGRSE